MFRLSSQLFSYLSILPSDLQEELLLLLPPKEIISKVSDLEDFERIGQRETFWKKVWRKWVSPRLPDSSEFPIREMISLMCKKAEELTPKQLLQEGSLKGILFYVIEALTREANVLREDDNALYYAVEQGSLDIVFYLVESGASISAREDKALRLAASKGHLDIVKYLVERGANISAREDEALRKAAFLGHFDIVKYLVERGANISAREDEALRNAAGLGYLSTVVYLV